MPPSAMSAADFWDRHEAVHSLIHRQTVEPYEAELITEAVDRAGGPDAVTSVVVLGVGAGRELGAVRAAAPRASIRACDVSPAMVEACRSYVAADGLADVTVELTAAADMVPGDAVVDVVIGVNAVLGYVQPGAERRRTFAALGQLVRPGGSLALVVQQRFGRPDWALWFAGRALTARLGLAEDPGGHRSVHKEASVLVHHFTTRELTSLLDSGGFDGIRCQSLRAFARHGRFGIPLRSPNPLLATAVRRS